MKQRSLIKPTMNVIDISVLLIRYLKKNSGNLIEIENGNALSFISIFLFQNFMVWHQWLNQQITAIYI